MRRCWQSGVDFVYLDLGYLRSGHFNGYYRVCWNGLHSALEHEPDYRRLLALKIPVADKDEANRLDPVLVVEPSAWIGRFFGFEPQAWTSRVVQMLMDTCPQRQVLVSRKGDGVAASELARCWAVVTLQSNIAVAAVAMAKPVFIVKMGVDAKCRHPAEWFGNTDLRAIDQPERADKKIRSLWLAKLAACQFTLREFETGVAWRWLERNYGTDDGEDPALLA